jgi:hypothetical protein
MYFESGRYLSFYNCLQVYILTCGFVANKKEGGGEPSSFLLLKRGESLVIYQNNL